MRLLKNAGIMRPPIIKYMRFALAIMLFFITAGICAQSDSVIVKENLIRLENALIAKNYEDMQGLLHHDVSYGHSTGWVQTKQDVIADCKSGKLSYYKIERNNMHVAAISKDWATVRYTGIIEAVGDGKDIKAALHVLQVWVKDKKGKWQLLARQATKLPEQVK